VENAPGRVADVVRAVLDLPLHRALGLSLVDPGRPELGLVLPVGEVTVNPSGVLHGGLVPLVLDVCSYLTLVPSLADDRHAVTVSSSCSLLAAVPSGQEARATATVERLGRTTAFLTARLTHGDRVVAVGQVVKALVSA
jgi:uncharacterized protein (TIGR00369 family)